MGQPGLFGRWGKTALSGLVISQNVESINFQKGLLPLEIRPLLSNERGAQPERAFYELKLVDLNSNTGSILQTGSTKFTGHAFAPGYSNVVETALSISLSPGNYQMKAIVKTGLEQEDVPAHGNVMLS